MTAFNVTEIEIINNVLAKYNLQYITFQRNTTTVVTLQLDNKNTFGITIEDSEAGIMPEPGTNDVTIVDGEIQ